MLDAVIGEMSERFSQLVEALYALDSDSHDFLAVKKVCPRLI
jgi:hypothetical protein